MKIVLHIFALYLLTLSLLPCGDGGAGILEITKHLFGVEHSHQSDHAEHSHDCGDDDCPPFCICTCCSSAIDYPSELVYQLDQPRSLPGTTPTFIPNLILTSFTTSVWQPPQEV